MNTCEKISCTLFLCLTLLVAYGEAKPSCDVDLVESTGDLHMLQANAKKVLQRRTGNSKTFSGDLTRILQLNEMASSSAMSFAAQLTNAKTTEKNLVPDTAPHDTEIVKLLQIQLEWLANLKAPTWIEKVGLTTACMTIGLMLSAVLYLKFAKSEVQEPPETSSTPNEAANLDVVSWVSLATCFCNVNFSCLLPNIALSEKQDFIQQGTLIGIYALGTVVTYPLFRRIPATQAKWAIMLHAIFTLIGNCTMVGALLMDSTFVLFFGRLMCGMEAGVKYTSNLVVVNLVPPKDRVNAAMTSRLYNSVSFALGPAVGAFPRMLIQATVSADRLALMPLNWAEAVPLAVMGVYGAVMALSLTCFRSDIKAPLDDSVEAPTTSGESQHQMDRYLAKVMFALMTANSFTVRYQRIVLEAGTLICLVHVYRFGDSASVILVLVAASLFLGRSLVIYLYKFIKDEMVILKVLDTGMLITCCCLFHAPTLPESLSVVLLVCGCMLFYNMNSCQSGVLMTAASKVAIKNDSYLSKAALTSYLFFSNVAAYFFGPVVTFLAMSKVTSQNLMAMMLAVSSVAQCSITNYGLSFVAAKQKILKEPSPTSKLSADSSGKGSTTEVAILIYQFGKYDFKGVDETWTLPKLTGINVSGFFFYNEGALSETDLGLIKSYDWMAIPTVLHEGTPYVCAERLTSKRTKWIVPDILKNFDIVITHDCDISAKYEMVVPNLVKKLLDENTSAVLQRHPKGKTVIQQIDEYLNNRPWRVLTSRENCIQWRAEIEDMMTSDDKYKFDAEHYVLSNCFAYRPRDPCWQRVGQKVYEKCHLIQRDQFMIPWAVQSVGLKHSWTTKEQLTEYGFRFRSQLRHLETGVYN